MAPSPPPEAVFRAPQQADQTAGRPRDDCAGPSLLDLMWNTLLEEMTALLPGGDYHEDAFQGLKSKSESEDEYQSWAEERARIMGVCQGITACIALVINPYVPNLDAVRAEAMERWGSRA